MNTSFLNHSPDHTNRFSTLVNLLSHRAQNQSDDTGYTFIQSGEEISSLTYGQLHLKAKAIAAKMQSLKLAGERALLLYQPGLDFIAAFFGCLYAGVIAVPANLPRKNRSFSRLQAITADAQAKVVLTRTDLLENRKQCFEENLELAELTWLATNELNSDASSWQQPEIDSESLAFLQYTSGSTGNPKGVVVSHANLLHNLALIHKCFGHTANSKGVIWLPPHHDMGLIGGILQFIYGGIPLVLMSPVDFIQKPVRWLQAISRYQATTSGGPNFAYDLCVNKIKPEQLASLDLSSWEVAFNGAEPIRAQTLERFAQTFADCGFRKQAFYPCYGMAETTLFVSGGLKAEPPIIRFVQETELLQNRVVLRDKLSVDSKGIVSCGRNWSEQKIMIANPESLIRCGDQEVGEIWVDGESVTQGYWQKPEQTQETFNAYLADTREGPFLRTGDLGFLQDGELFVTGRIKDLIIIRGQNHYPQDIESTVQQCHPALRPDCGAAFSVEIKGEERLVIVQEVERNYLRDLDVQKVVGNVTEAVTAQYGLQVYATVLVKTGSIPKTSSGKIQHYACRTAFLNGSLNVLERSEREV